SEWAGYWPTSTDEPFASWINGAQKHVASTTLDSTDAWANSTLIKGELADHVADLREREGGTIGTAGSPTLVRSLIDLGLLDEAAEAAEVAEPPRSSSRRSPGGRARSHGTRNAAMASKLVTASALITSDALRPS